MMKNGLTSIAVQVHTNLRRWFIFEFSKIPLSQGMNTKNIENKTKQNVSAKNNFDI